METLDQEAILEESQQETVSLFLIWKRKQDKKTQNSTSFSTVQKLQYRDHLFQGLLDPNPLCLLV